jgi:uncharacterized protein (TIGR02145 family)
VRLRISILSGSITGPAVYVETHARTTDAGGLMSLQIGGGTLPSMDFATINWGNSAHFIKLEADFSGGNSYVLLGTQELMSVPYALYASTTDTSVLNLTNRFSTKFNVSDTTILSNRINAKLNISDFPAGSTTGNIMFFNGNSWVNLAPGAEGQVLKMSSGSPVWGSVTTSAVLAGTASSTPTLTVNTALTNITHATLSATGIGTASSLPTGVSAIWSGNVITISGTPDTVGTFNYTIPLTGTGCTSLIATGTITVVIELATLTTTALSNITCAEFSSGGNISSDGGALVTSRGVVWSTGTGPTVSLTTKTTNSTGTGFFTSTISGLTASTTYYVRAYATNSVGTSYGSELTFITRALYTASTPSTSPTVIVNTSLTPSITIATTGATGIGTVSGLPTGVSAIWSANVITISGTPDTVGTFNYTIPLTGTSCNSVNATGTITVSAACAAGMASSTPTLNLNTLLTNITHATTGATGIGTPTGLPAGVSADWSANVITISGTPDTMGTFNYTIPLTGTSCNSVNATGSITVTETACGSVSSVSDVDMNTYTTVSIGTQCWTVTNLRVRRYNDGTEINFNNSGGMSGVTSQTWSVLDYGTHTIYAHDSTATTPSNLTKYGYLYNWYAAKGIATAGSTTYKNICPTGWHVPTDSDWNKLIKSIHSGADTTTGTQLQSYTAGGKMKSTGDNIAGTGLWRSPNTGADNSTGFTALPGGYRSNTGAFTASIQSALFWSATEHSSLIAWSRILQYNFSAVARVIFTKSVGGSIRCLRD